MVRNENSVTKSVQMILIQGVRFLWLYASLKDFETNGQIDFIYRTKVKTLHYNYLYFKRKHWTKIIY